MSVTETTVPLRPPPVHRGRVAIAGVGLGLLFLPVAAWPLVGANVPLGPCGLGVLRYDDKTWTAVTADAFASPANAPSGWVGHGIVTRVHTDRLHYLDFSGTRLTFSPGSANPTGC